MHRVCVNWKTPQKFNSIPRLLSIIVGYLHPPYYARFLCQESINRNQDSNKFSPGAPTPKHPQGWDKSWEEASPEAGRSGR